MDDAGTPTYRTGGETNMPLFRHLAIASLALAPAGAHASDPPRAIYADPPIDPAHPANMLEIEIPSHGAMMNAIVYRPSGVGPFPLVVFVHGLPGNEQNLDLAQALRRAGWAVLTFHYRGAFGSEGDFSIDHVLEDADAVTDYVRSADVARKWNIDAGRVVLMGHSLGGLAAAHASAHAPDRMATVLIAPWDPSTLAGLMRPLSPNERDAMSLNRWSDVSHGRLRGTTAQQIGAEIVDHGERWRLADNAPPLVTRPTLLITATRDLDSSKAKGLKAALAGTGAKLDMVELETNHGFDDHRIALETVILEWLAALPGAPVQR
jgi:acetyl esterase/lipase